MKIGICSDHRGFYLKTQLLEKLKENGYDVVDYGCDSDESVDFPDYAIKLGEAIKAEEVERGIAICGTGIGMSIALNKIHGIYCANVKSASEIMICRSHNDVNCVAMSEDVSVDDGYEICTKFISTPFSNIDKYIRRNNKIKKLEEENENRYL